MGLIASGASIDVQTIEKGFRAAALHDGNAAFCHFLSMIGDGEQECPTCHVYLEKIDDREKSIVSLMGTGTIKRGYFICPNGHGNYIPRDEMIGVQGTSFTPGVRLAASKLAVAGSFDWSSEALAEIADIYVSAKGIQRISEEAGAIAENENQKRINAAMHPGQPSGKLCECSEIAGAKDATLYIEYDGTGVPMTRREVAGIRGKQPDGSAKTREAKCGCMFTQSLLDDEGKPVRDENSTSFFGAIECAELFGRRVFAEAQRREYDTYARIAIIGDGAKWIWGIASQYFPKAVQIVDLYHAKEHLHNLARDLFPNPAEHAAVLADWINTLELGRAKALGKKILAVANLNEAQRKKANTEANYFIENAYRMHYRYFKKQKLFVGSGIAEATCKTLIGGRLKQSGMFWSLNGANAIISLRCVDMSCNGEFSILFSPQQIPMDDMVA
jgi:hypothetical protein